MSKFQLKPRAASEQPATAEQFSSGAALVQSQTGGRSLKPIRVNFDLDPATHCRLRQRALDRGLSVAELLRDLITAELSK
jgi:hypothetical protein